MGVMPFLAACHAYVLCDIVLVLLYVDSSFVWQIKFSLSLSQWQCDINAMVELCDF